MTAVERTFEHEIGRLHEELLESIPELTPERNNADRRIAQVIVKSDGETVRIRPLCENPKRIVEDIETVLDNHNGHS